jgi:hypothetical protein
MGALAVLLGVTLALSGQDAPATDSVQPGQAVAQLEDVVVEGRPVEELVADFVAEAAVPARGRGLARWQGDICPGVVNLRPDAAQYIADRVSQVALDLGLVPGEPGCRANIIIVFTVDGAALTARLAEQHRRAFRSRAGGMERGNVAFAEFVESRRPVKWWHISMPTDAATGQRAIRLPGEVNNFGVPTAPQIGVFAASRLNSQIRDDMRKVMVIVDVDELGAANLVQLADYIAFVSLAQVDPAADISAYDSVLKLFDQPATVPEGLTDWDRSYLTSLYETLDAPQLRRNPSAVSSGVADAMTRDRRAAQDEPTEDD